MLWRQTIWLCKTKTCEKLNILYLFKDNSCLITIAICYFNCFNTTSSYFLLIYFSIFDNLLLDFPLCTPVLKFTGVSSSMFPKILIKGYWYLINMAAVINFKLKIMLNVSTYANDLKPIIINGDEYQYCQSIRILIM